MPLHLAKLWIVSFGSAFIASSGRLLYDCSSKIDLSSGIPIDLVFLFLAGSSAIVYGTELAGALAIVMGAMVVVTRVQLRTAATRVLIAAPVVCATILLWSLA